jgi:YVTN family beta-propeller protein
MKQLPVRQIRLKLRKFLLEHPILTGVVAAKITVWLDNREAAVRNIFSPSARHSASAPIPPPIPPSASAPIPPQVASAPIPPRIVSSNFVQNAYITNQGRYPFSASTVSVIDTMTNTVTATIPVGPASIGVAASSVAKVYVTNLGDNSVSVIDTATNTVTAKIFVGSGPFGVAVTPDGGKVYVANRGSNTVSVIDTATNTVTATIPVGVEPLAFGVFIVPPVARPEPATRSLSNGRYSI